MESEVESWDNTSCEKHFHSANTVFQSPIPEMPIHNSTIEQGSIDCSSPMSKPVEGQANNTERPKPDEDAGAVCMKDDRGLRRIIRNFTPS